MSYERTTGITVFKAGEAPLEEVPWTDTARITVFQPIGGSGQPDLMGLGFATYEGHFDEDVQYDAGYYILEGTLTLRDGDVVHTAHQGDIMFMPKGSKVVYESPEGCKVFFAIYPGNWEEITEPPAK